MGNQHGKQHYGRNIDWENAERPSPPGKPYLVPDGTDNDVIEIRWAKPMSDGGAPILGFVVEHRRTGSPHWLRASPHLIEETHLVLTGLEPGWRYQFRVSAENAIGRSDPGQLSEPLTVTLHQAAASAPHFNRELQDTIALENETVEFVVQVIATPPPKISWYKDGFELFSSRRTKIVNDDETSTLIIYQAALEDEGEIKCTATNRAGHIVSKATLRLEALPRIRLPRQYEEGLLFEKGETMRLKVTSAGRPPPIVTWHHNGEKIQSRGRYEVTEIEGGSTLRIADACRDDRGEYLVQGMNKIGADIVSFLVTITDRPSAPGRPEVVMTLGKSVTLGWSCPEDDGGCKIGAYIVEYFRVGWDMWLKAATSRQLTATLSDLIEGSQYKFRIKAENPYGISEPSAESDAIFIPDTKRGILKPDGKTSPMIFDSPWDEQPKLRSILKSTEGEEAKKRQISPAPDVQETEGAKKRRLLEENARKLLDTPLSVLLSESAATPRTIEKPPRKFKIENRSPSVSPTPFEMQSSPPPVPKRRNKNKQTSDEESLSSTNAATPPPTRLNVSPVLLRDDSLLHGSSELMLVLLPESDSKSRGELSERQKSEIELSLAEPGVAPPMSLSAPELGAEELLEFPPLRNAVSSTELLYVRAMARIYQDSEDDIVARRRSVERRPSLHRKSSFRESALERRHSFKETISSGADDEKDKDKLEQPSIVNHINENEISSAKVDTSKTPPKSILKKEERLSSVEREHLEFAKVRERLRLKNETTAEPPSRPPSLRVQSSMGSQRSSFDAEESIPEEDEFIEDEEEEDYEDEFIEEEEEEHEEEEMEEEESPVVEEQLKREEVLPERPPIVPKHGPPRRVLEPERRREPPRAVEEDTYHPRSMIPTRSVLRAIPAAVVEEVKIPTIEVEEPEKEERTATITKKSEETITNSTDSLSSETKNTTSRIPVAKNQNGEKKKSKLLKKIGFGLRRDKKKDAVETLAEDAVAPVASVALPKPILKKVPPLKKKDKGKDKNKTQEGDSPPKMELDEPKKKQVRISEPSNALSIPVVDDPKLSPRTNARNQRLQRRQQSLEEEEQANQVLIHHYSDIVREFGGPKKTPPKIYTDFEELEAHAPEESKEPEEIVVESNETEEIGTPLDEVEVEDEVALKPNQESIAEPVEDLIAETEIETAIEREGTKTPEPPESVKDDASSERTHSPSPLPKKIVTPEERVRSSVEYLTDVAIFLFACWLYLFKNELYVIPVLLLLVYRQIHESAKEKYNLARQAVVDKIPQRFRKKSDDGENEDNNNE